MEALRASGLDAVTKDAVRSGRPFLGICVGMQMLYEGSEEDPGVAGLGLLPGIVRRLPDGVKHPQMQWNTLVVEHDHPLLRGLQQPSWMYFVHSYAPERSATGDEVVASCDYGHSVVAAVARDNVFATQFHPEKSGDDGLGLLRNFAATCS
jgi:glutamine amidotransferase